MSSLKEEEGVLIRLILGSFNGPRTLILIGIGEGEDSDRESSSSSFFFPGWAQWALGPTG